MGRVVGVLVLIPLVAAVAGCGAKKPPPVAAGAPTVEIPETWSGVSFAEDLGALGSNLAIPTTPACGDVSALEPKAAEGTLTDEEIVCLDHALRLEPKQTAKDALSRLLMADAWAKGDMHRWEGAVRRHLTEIDSSDPDLAYLLAVRLGKEGAGSAFEAIRFAELAMENHEAWGPEVHAERVETLLRVRALSAATLWYHYEDELLKEKTTETTAQVDRWRSVTKANAREWLEHSWGAGEDVSVAYELCVSAAGTLAYCEIGFDEAAAQGE